MENKGSKFPFLFLSSPQFLGQNLYQRTVFDIITYIQDQFKGSNIIQRKTESEIERERDGVLCNQIEMEIV